MLTANCQAAARSCSCGTLYFTLRGRAA